MVLYTEHYAEVDCFNELDHEKISGIKRKNIKNRALNACAEQPILNSMEK